MPLYLINILVLLVLVTALTPKHLAAAMFQLPVNGDNMVGQIQHTKVKKGDTIVELARQLDVGYEEIVTANPHLDPWLIQADTQLIIPSQYILPPQPWEGVIVNIAEMRLYYFPPRQNNERGIVITFPVSIGRSLSPTPEGSFKIVDKIQNPAWTVPKTVREEHKNNGKPIDAILPPGPDNPLGDYALVLDNPGYLIHGTNKPYSIGRKVSHGCLRLYPEDIEQLSNRIARGTAVQIINEPIKTGRLNNIVYIKHQNFVTTEQRKRTEITREYYQDVKRSYKQLEYYQLNKIRELLSFNDGISRPLWALNKLSAAPQTLFLSVNPNFKLINRQVFKQHILNLSLKYTQDKCGSNTCIKIGPIRSIGLRRAVAEHIKHSFGVSSYNVSSTYEY